MAKVKLGKAKFGGQKKKYWKLKDGESVFRILPPLGDLADDGKWSVFYKVHYGYKNAEGKSRPFQSSLVINRSNKMVESPDAAQERIDKLKAELEKAKSSKNKAAMDQLLKYVDGAKSMYNLDSNHYLNAIDEQGNIGVLKLRHRAKLALDATIRSLREKGVDPLSVDNGRFFVFRRSGNALETTFQVEVLRKTENIAGVGEVQREVVHKLTDDIIDRLGDEAAQLDKLFRLPTGDQVARIVAESNMQTGVSPNIDEILGLKTNGSTGSSGGEEEFDDSEDEDDNSTQAAAAATATTTTSTTPTVAATLVTVETALGAHKERVSEEPQTPVVVETAKPAVKIGATQAQTTSDTVANMSDDEFLKSLGLN